MQFPDLKSAFRKLVESVKSVLYGLLIPLQVFLNVVLGALCCLALMIVKPIWKLMDNHLPNSEVTAILYRVKKKLEVFIQPRNDDV